MNSSKKKTHQKTNSSYGKDDKTKGSHCPLEENLGNIINLKTQSTREIYFNAAGNKIENYFAMNQNTNEAMTNNRELNPDSLEAFDYKFNNFEMDHQAKDNIYFKNSDFGKHDEKHIDFQFAAIEQLKFLEEAKVRSKGTNSQSSKEFNKGEAQEEKIHKQRKPKDINLDMDKVNKKLLDYSYKSDKSSKGFFAENQSNCDNSSSEISVKNEFKYILESMDVSPEIKHLNADKKNLETIYNVNLEKEANHIDDKSPEQNIFEDIKLPIFQKETKNDGEFEDPQYQGQMLFQRCQNNFPGGQKNTPFSYIAELNKSLKINNLNNLSNEEFINKCSGKMNNSQMLPLMGKSKGLDDNNKEEENNKITSNYQKQSNSKNNQLQIEQKEFSINNNELNFNNHGNYYYEFQNKQQIASNSFFKNEAFNAKNLKITNEEQIYNYNKACNLQNHQNTQLNTYQTNIFQEQSNFFHYQRYQSEQKLSNNYNFNLLKGVGNESKNQIQQQFNHNEESLKFPINQININYLYNVNAPKKNSPMDEIQGKDAKCIPPEVRDVNVNNTSSNENLNFCKSEKNSTDFLVNTNTNNNNGTGVRQFNNSSNSSKGGNHMLPQNTQIINPENDLLSNSENKNTGLKLNNNSNFENKSQVLGTFQIDQQARNQNNIIGPQQNLYPNNNNILYSNNCNFTLENKGITHNNRFSDNNFNKDNGVRGVMPNHQQNNLYNPKESTCPQFNKNYQQIQQNIIPKNIYQNMNKVSPSSNSIYSLANNIFPNCSQQYNKIIQPNNSNMKINEYYPSTNGNGSSHPMIPQLKTGLQNPMNLSNNFMNQFNGNVNPTAIPNFLTKTHSDFNCLRSEPMINNSFCGYNNFNNGINNNHPFNSFNNSFNQIPFNNNYNYNNPNNFSMQLNKNEHLYNPNWNKLEKMIPLPQNQIQYSLGKVEKIGSQSQITNNLPIKKTQQINKNPAFSSADQYKITLKKEPLENEMITTDYNEFSNHPRNEIPENNKSKTQEKNSCNPKPEKNTVPPSRFSQRMVVKSTNSNNYSDKETNENNNNQHPKNFNKVDKFNKLTKLVNSNDSNKGENYPQRSPNVKIFDNDNADTDDDNDELNIELKNHIVKPNNYSNFNNNEKSWRKPAKNEYNSNSYIDNQQNDDFNGLNHSHDKLGVYEKGDMEDSIEGKNINNYYSYTCHKNSNASCSFSNFSGKDNNYNNCNNNVDYLRRNQLMKCESQNTSKFFKKDSIDNNNSISYYDRINKDIKDNNKTQKGSFSSQNNVYIRDSVNYNKNSSGNNNDNGDFSAKKIISCNDFNEIPEEKNKELNNKINKLEEALYNRKIDAEEYIETECKEDKEKQTNKNNHNNDNCKTDKIDIEDNSDEDQDIKPGKDSCDLIKAPKVTPQDYENYLKGEIILTLKDKQRSKALQKLVTKLAPETIELIFNEVYPTILEDMENDFCNYFFQKFFKVLNKEQGIKILLLFQTNCTLYDYAKSSHGVYLLCSLLSRDLSSEEVHLISESFHEHLNEMLTEKLAHKILIKIILKLPEKYYSKVLQTILDDFIFFAKNKFSNEVIRIVLSKQNLSPNIYEKLAEEVIKNLIVLAKDEIANSIVTACLFNLKLHFKKEIASVSLNDILDLSVNKYSSGIVERIIEIIKIPYCIRFFGKIFGEENFRHYFSQFSTFIDSREDNLIDNFSNNKHHYGKYYNNNNKQNNGPNNAYNEFNPSFDKQNYPNNSSYYNDNCHNNNNNNNPYYNSLNRYFNLFSNDHFYYVFKKALKFINNNGLKERISSMAWDAIKRCKLNYKTQTKWQKILYLRNY